MFGCKLFNISVRPCYLSHLWGVHYNQWSMQIIKNVITRLDAFQRRHPFVGFPFAVIKKYGDDEAGHRAALLAYYGFLAIFPLLMVLTTLLSQFLKNNTDAQEKILKAATDYVPVIGTQLADSVNTFDQTGLALFIGVLLALYGVRGLADAFRGAINHVWQVPYVKRTTFPGSLIKSLVIIVIGGLGFLAVPVLAAFAVSFGTAWIYRIIALSLTLVILFCLFVFLARTAMSQARPVKDVWIGALFTAVCVMILQSIGNYLLTHELNKLQDLYSTFAIVLGMMFWLFLQTQVVLYAMEIDTVRVYKLWPRSMDSDNRTDADKAAYRLYAKRNSWHKDDEIELVEGSKKRPILERLRDLTHEDSKDKDA